MKSIRLSLLVYFLGLLALALGAVSLLVYHTTRETLLAKKEATEKLLHAQYLERCTKDRERVDAALLAQATALSRVVDLPQRLLTVPELTVSGVLLNSTSSLGRITLPAWLLTNRDRTTYGRERALGPLGRDFYKEYYREPPPSERKFNEQVLDREIDPQVADYCQINSLLGHTYHSPGLRLDGRSLPFDAASAPNRVIGWEHDELMLDAQKLRRVTLTSPYPRFFRFGFFPLPRSEDKDRPASRHDPMLRPAIVVQCAADAGRLEATLTSHAAAYEQEKARLEAETESSLSSLRARLLLIGVATFAATAIGGLVLVRIGLAPLGRLSDAVSQVSEKDFRLPLGKAPLPQELRPIAARLTATLDQLKRAFQREKQAAADISHELRTPLAALLTTIDVTLRKPRDAESYRETLEECRSNGQQMSRLVERLLTLARIDAGVDPLRPRPVDVADLAEQCATMVRPLAEARSLELTVHVPGPTSLNADPDKLREVLNNLLHNAIQYNRPHGRIELTVARENGSVRMEVRDTGIGISPDARERIFERFYRADPSRQNDGLNSGLGLAIVKGYVDLMGGTIAVESTPGQGSRFCVDLPVHKA